MKAEEKIQGRIYVITNKVNGKKYVGQTTKPIEKRFQQHMNPSSKCTLLAKAVQKYGKDSFIIQEV